jgi:two-component system sensor histidine kinase HydH
MARLPNRMTLARWGWLLSTSAIGAAVIGSAWSSWRSSELAADDLVRGQAAVYTHAAMLAFALAPPDKRNAALDSAVQAHAFEGLRYVALVRSDGPIVASGGTRDATPVGPIDSVTIRFRGIRPQRLRVSYPPAQGRRIGEVSFPGVGTGFSQWFAGIEGHRPIVVMEFEPLIAEQLSGRVRATLLLGVTVAALLVVAALEFWRISRRLELEERRALDQRRLAALGQMSAVLAHEIRNPLAALKGHAQLLVERVPTDVADHRNATRIVTEATRLEGLTSDLLEFARSGPIDVRPTDPLIPLHEADVGLPGLLIERNDAPAEWPLDAHRLRRVLANILQNAIQATRASRPPLYSIGMENGHLVYTIRDFGPGLPTGPEVQIFEPFFTTRTSGTGLGLAVAR